MKLRKKKRGGGIENQVGLEMRNDQQNDDKRGIRSREIKTTRRGRSQVPVWKTRTEMIYIPFRGLGTFGALAHRHINSRGPSFRAVVGV